MISDLRLGLVGKYGAQNNAAYIYQISLPSDSNNELVGSVGRTLYLTYNKGKSPKTQTKNLLYSQDFVSIPTDCP